MTLAEMPVPADPDAPSPSLSQSDLQQLTEAILAFRDERDWKQFHSLRHLIVSLNLEAAELLELTQWKSDQEMTALSTDAKGREALADECADVLLYLLLLTAEAGIDLKAAALAKIAKNAAKYPVHKARGSSRKYTELE
ncbi:MAG TPA: MazG-like family protein [Azospira sp.]|nr:MazG-like family protein [Azospira sp.]